MLVVTGMFENKTFVPDKPVLLPQKKKVVLTIEEEKEEGKYTFKELAAKAKILRSRIEAETGILNVCALIHEGRNR